MAPASSAEGAPAAPIVLCAGIAVIDRIFSVAAYPAEGTKTRARAIATIGGGCAANAAVAVARLGGRAQLAAPLGGPAGADFTGDAILARLAREGVDTRAVIRHAGAPSPVSTVILADSGERTIVNYRDDTLSSVRCVDPAALVAGVAAVLIDNRFPEFVLPIARAARDSGNIVLMDADEPTRETANLLAACSHVVFSANGLRATAGTAALPEALMRIGAQTPARLAVTDGGRGLLWLDEGTVRTMETFAVEAVDTLAAGDVFHGACTLALAEGRPFAQALRFASAAAAIKCTRPGGIAGAPARGEVEALLAGSEGFANKTTCI